MEEIVTIKKELDFDNSNMCSNTTSSTAEDQHIYKRKYIDSINIIDERPDMITVSVDGLYSEDERNFIANLKMEEMCEFEYSTIIENEMKENEACAPKCNYSHIKIKEEPMNDHEIIGNNNGINKTNGFIAPLDVNIKKEIKIEPNVDIDKITVAQNIQTLPTQLIVNENNTKSKHNFGSTIDISRLRLPSIKKPIIAAKENCRSLLKVPFYLNVRDQSVEATNLIGTNISAPKNSKPKLTSATRRQRLEQRMLKFFQSTSAKLPQLGTSTCQAAVQKQLLEFKSFNDLKSELSRKITKPLVEVADSKDHRPELMATLKNPQSEGTNIRKINGSAHVNANLDKTEYVVLNLASTNKTTDEEDINQSANFKNYINILDLPPNTKIVPISNAQFAQRKKTNVEETSSEPENTKRESRKDNRQSWWSQHSMNKIEKLPESRKVIENLQKQIRFVEQAARIPKTSSILVDNQDPKTPLTSASILQKENIIMNEQESEMPVPESLYLPLSTTQDELLNQARNSYPNYRFSWKCPICPREYELKYAFRSHLVTAHDVDKKELNKLIIQVRPSKFIIPNSIKKEIIDAVVPEVESIEIEPAIKFTDASCEQIEITPVRGFEDYSVSVSKLAIKQMCRKCKASFANESQLIEHVMGRTCKRVKNYKCEVCCKYFASVSTLNCHMTVHTGELPYKCNYCAKRFRTRGQVTVHHRTHTGEKPFKCQVCGQCFTHRETLISHLSRHLGMKRYKCYGCDKTFSCISGLRTHRDVRPETCGRVKFIPHAIGPRVRVVRGNVIFD